MIKITGINSIARFNETGKEGIPFAPSLTGFICKGPYKYCDIITVSMFCSTLKRIRKEQINLIIDPQYQDIVRNDQIMIEEIFNSIIAANDDKW